MRRVDAGKREASRATAHRVRRVGASNRWSFSSSRQKSRATSISGSGARPIAPGTELRVFVRFHAGTPSPCGAITFLSVVAGLRRACERRGQRPADERCLSSQ